MVLKSTNENDASLSRQPLSIIIISIY